MNGWIGPAQFNAMEAEVKFLRQQGQLILQRTEALEKTLSIIQSGTAETTEHMKRAEETQAAMEKGLNGSGIWIPRGTQKQS